MKHNFIQNLSDQVFRQNYQLKTSLQIVKNQLKDYQWQMVQFISLVAPNINIYEDIFQVFQQFVRLVKDKFHQTQLLKSHISQLRQKYEQIRKEEVNFMNDLNKRKSEQQAIRRKYQEKISEKEKEIKQLNLKIEQLQENSNNLIHQMCQARIEKLKLQQSIRKQIEEAKKLQNSQFNSYRQKDELEHLSVYNQLKKDIDMRDKTIRQMSKSIALLTNSIDIKNSQKILEDIFRSFQKFQQLSDSYKNLKKQNEQLRNQIKSLFNRIVAEETKLQQAKQIEYNLLNQIQRCGLQKRELQAKIMGTMNELSKCNADKASMEQYYDMKWNDQYQNVKLKLEKSSKTKIQALKRECDQKIEEFEQRRRQAEREKLYYAERAKELLTKCNEGDIQRKRLQDVIILLNQKIVDLRQINFEINMMHAQEILACKVSFQTQLEEHRLACKQMELGLQKKIQEMSQQYSILLSQIQRLKMSCQGLQQRQRQLVEEQRKTLAYYQAQQIKKLKEEMSKQMELIPSIKVQVEQQITSKFKVLLQQKDKTIQLKQQDYASNNSRWVHKYCELQKLHLFTRNKLEQEIQSQQQQVKALLTKEHKLHVEIQSFKTKTNCLTVQIKSLQAQIYNNKLAFIQKDDKMFAFNKEITTLKLQIQVLMASKKTWKQQLMQLQKEFFKQFQQLNKINLTATNKLKDKVRQLQDLNRQNGRNRREMLKIQILNNEKLTLKSQITKKQAQNKILHEVKDYYEAKLKEADREIGKYQFKNTHVILTRRLKKNRLQNTQSKSHRIFSPKESADKKRYEITSVKKKFEVTESNLTLRDNERKYRRQTMTSLN